MSTKGQYDGHELEARISQLWFWEGYFARNCINLQRYYHPKPLQITDLDLLAFEFGPTLQRRKYIGEAKSGKGKNAPAPLDRLVWLKGLIALTQADGAELTTATIPSQDVRDLASSLGAVAQSVEDIERREKLTRIAEVANLGSQGPEFQLELSRVRQACRDDVDLERAFWFLRCEVYLLDEWLATKRTMTLIRRISQRWVPGLTSDEQFALKWILCEAVCVVALNLVTIARQAIYLEPTEYASYVGERLAEGLAPAPVMHRISKEIDKFINGVLAEANVPQSVRVQSLGAFLPSPPQYTDPLVEVTRRLAVGAPHARHVPRYLDLVLFERVLREREVSDVAIQRLGLSDPGLVARAARLIAAYLRGQADLIPLLSDAITRPSVTTSPQTSPTDEEKASQPVRAEIAVATADHREPPDPTHEAVQPTRRHKDN